MSKLDRISRLAQCPGSGDGNAFVGRDAHGLTPHRLGLILKAEPESVLVIQDVLIAHHQHQQMRSFLLIFTFYIDHIKWLFDHVPLALVTLTQVTD
jgi:hypothetical protein